MAWVNPVLHNNRLYTSQRTRRLTLASTINWCGRCNRGNAYMAPCTSLHSTPSMLFNMAVTSLAFSFRSFNTWFFSWNRSIARRKFAITQKNLWDKFKVFWLVLNFHGIHWWMASRMDLPSAKDHRRHHLVADGWQHNQWPPWNRNCTAL